MAQAVKVDQKLFSAAKILFENGATTTEVARYLKISEETARRIKNSESLEEYRQEVSAIKASYAARHKKEGKKEEITLDKTSPKTMDAKDYYMVTKLIKAVEEQNEILKLISNKIVYIVEQLS